LTEKIMNSEPKTPERFLPKLLREAFYRASAAVSMAATSVGVVIPHAILPNADAIIVAGLVGGVGTYVTTALYHRTKYNSFSAAYNHYAANGREAKVAALYMAVGAAPAVLRMYGIGL
jgi:hypothetical protein